MKNLLLLLSFFVSHTVFSQTFTWMGGSSVCCQQGAYGQLGVSSSSNMPKARHDAVTWIDVAGNLWMFGGTSGSNDLWKYMPSTNLWTWVNGDTTKSAMYGKYGIKGIPSATVQPGGRRWANSWIDTSGCLWLFGGYGYAQHYSSWTHLNDLWKFDPITNKWAWIAGDSTTGSPTKWGPAGVPSATADPGARFGALSFVDKSNNLYLFGGQGFGTMLNDVWKYSVATNEWTPMDNSRPEIYGTAGVYYPDHGPPGRYLAAGTVDQNGDFWLFTGNGYNSQILHDVWKYSVSLNQWAWIAGDSTSMWKPASYGFKNVFDPFSTPGARWSPIAFSDSHGMLYLFAGVGYPGGFLNDLWKFNPNVSQWAWVGGSNLKYQVGTYGVMGQGSPANIPGRRAAQAYWVDKQDNLWLFGGFNNGLGGDGDWNDLWKVSLPTKIVGIDGPNMVTENVTVFPVPAHNACVIKSDNMFYKINLFNSQGALLYRSDFNDQRNEFQMDLSGFAQGVYFFEVMFPDGRTIRLKQMMN